MTREALSTTLAALDGEWRALCREHPALPATWHRAVPTLALGDGLSALPDAARRDPDPTLLGLLALHRAGDAVAGRTLVHLFLGKLTLMARRDATASLQDYLGALWERVATYPLDRRPRRVAANLVLDTLKLVVARRAAPQGGLPARVADPTGDADAVLAAGVRLGLIDERTRCVLECVYVVGCTSAVAGARLGLSPDAVRWRCSRGIRALRAGVPDLLDSLAA